MNTTYFIRTHRATHVVGFKLGRGVLLAAALAAALASNPAAAAAPRQCDLQLIVELTPDAPNVRDEGFLSSLLNNHPGYRLTLQQRRGDSAVAVELTGPGPEYRCRNVVNTMRKDGRVLSVHVR